MLTFAVILRFGSTPETPALYILFFSDGKYLIASVNSDVLESNARYLKGEAAHVFMAEN